jgi:hypothetical protein
MSTRKDVFLTKTVALSTSEVQIFSEVFDLFEAKTKNDVHNIHAQFEVSLPPCTVGEEGQLVVILQSSDDPEFGDAMPSMSLVCMIETGTHEAKKGQVKASEKPKRYWRLCVQQVDVSFSEPTAEFAIVF